MEKSAVDLFIGENKERLLKTLEELCRIPAPSHGEQRRAEYCKAWLEEIGARGVYVDSALNVILPLGCDGKTDITVFAAHTDTVFPDTEPMPYLDDGERIFCPGVADDTASVAVILMMAKYFIENPLERSGGIMLACNSCEEGLGNLKGTRRLFEDFKGRIGRFITFDSKLNIMVDRCVGSHRYEVEINTEGGHSYSSFGSKNAIAELSEIISEIYKISVPEKENTRTTYNVGTVTGGTSVNTVAQNARMLCEYRSDDAEALQIMKEKFDAVFEAARSRGTDIKVTPVGDRPCGESGVKGFSELRDKAAEIIKSVIKKPLHFVSGSTDCNIPVSLGIPAICVGISEHGWTHTREEYLEKASLLKGLKIAVLLGKTL